MGKNKVATYGELVLERMAAEKNLESIKKQIDQLPGIEFIRGAAKYLALDSLLSEHTFTDFLVGELIQRDEPMLESEIRAVFQASGAFFLQSHIDACNPDSQEAVNEQIQHYRE